MGQAASFATVTHTLLFAIGGVAPVTSGIDWMKLPVGFETAPW